MGHGLLDAHYQWNLVESEDDQLVNKIATEQKLSPVVAKILVNRGYQTGAAVDTFLHPQLDQCYDPFLMHDMQKAVERIQQAIEAGETITVYGDYDADGVTSTALMYETLLTVGAEVNYYVPNRFSDGYGPNVAAFKRLIDDGTQLIVTVDNGVAGHDAIDAANKLGVDVVVTDHHELPKQLPSAYAIVHPRFPGSQYPFGDLSGVGVAFKVAWALLDEFPVELLDLVAIGEVADLVSVTDENRILITYGLQQLRNGMRPGIHELIKIAGLNEQTLTETNIGFGIAPRLNALGRMGDANPGVQLLTSLDDDEASQLAKMVDEKNKQRQTLVTKIAQEALQQATSEQGKKQPVLLLAGHGWHEGVLGIVASRVVEQVGKPTIVVNVDDETGNAKGSGRSIDGFDLFHAVDAYRELTVAFGGHQMAVGLTVKADQLDKLRTGLVQAAAEQSLSQLPKQQLEIAARINPDDVDLTLFSEIEQLAPFGTGNPRPQFLFADCQVADVKQIGKENAHLKLALKGQTGSLSAIAFNQGTAAPIVQAAKQNVAFVGSLDENEWRGNRSVQLMIKDIKINGIPVVDQRTNKLALPLFEPAGLYLVFDDQLMQKMIKSGTHSRFVAAHGLDEGQLIDQSVTIVDCPPSLSAFQNAFDVGGQPAALRLLMYQNDDAYLTGMPSRDELARLYKFVYSHQNVNVHSQLDTLGHFLGIDRSKLIFMVQLFFEVGFVKIEDGVLNGIPDPAAVDFSTAAVYQQRQQLIEAEKVLIYSDSTDLRHWVLGCITSD